MDKQKIIIMSLVVTLFLIVQYVILEKWVIGVRRDMVASYENGYNVGAKNVLTAIYEQTKNCQVAKITIDNLTQDIFDVTCLHDNSTKIHP